MLLAKAAGLYDRDQFVLHKTTLDEAPALVGVAAIFALTIEGVQAFLYTGGSHPLPMWVILTAALVVARGAARFVTVRTTARRARARDRRRARPPRWYGASWPATPP